MDYPTEGTLGDWLKELRERARLSQKAAGAALGVDDRAIRRWEAKTIPSGDVLLRLLSAYGVRLDPPPPANVPRAVNAELAELRQKVSESNAELAQMFSDRLEEALRLARELPAEAPPEQPPPTPERPQEQ